MRRTLCYAALVAAVTLSHVAHAVDDADAPDDSAARRVIGYLPDYRLDQLDDAMVTGVTDVVFFSATPRPDGAVDLPGLGDDDDALGALHTLRKKHGFRLWLCVGGWGRSDHFTTIAADPARQRRFAHTLAALCGTHGFDGVDIDWEYPANDEAWRGFVAILRHVRAALPEQRRRLSIALSSAHLPPAEAFEHVDHVNLMSYDGEGRHATFDMMKRDVQRLRDAGAPPHKIVVGVPFYGRSITDRQLAMTYDNVVKAYGPKPDVDEVDGIYFNGPVTIRHKTRWAVEQRLKGVMIWELGQDASGDASLLRTIIDAIREPTNPQQPTPTGSQR